MLAGFLFFFFLLFNFGHQPLYGAVFQHNNAKTIAARYTTLFVAYNIVQILLCLPSPWISLHPIEHIWDELDRRVRGRMNALANVQKWVAIPVRVISNRIQFRPKRC